MATKLRVWNDALIAIGERTISDTGEVVESARYLTHVWDQTVKYCLEAGQWNFAIRDLKITADTGITTNFGYNKVFAKPSDWVRTVGLSADEYNHRPLADHEYKDEDKLWLTDVDPIYVRFVSSDTGNGFELSLWPESFARYVSLELADRVNGRLTDGEKKDDLEKKRDKAKRFALSKDAINEGTRYAPAGRLVSGRLGFGRRDRGGWPGSTTY